MFVPVGSLSCPASEYLIGLALRRHLVPRQDDHVETLVKLNGSMYNGGFVHKAVTDVIFHVRFLGASAKNFP